MSALIRQIKITHPVGLHARPAVKFTKLAKTFTADISIRGLPEGKFADAKSVAKVMGLKLKSGRDIEISADGSDAENALRALGGLVERNFDEGA